MTDPLEIVRSFYSEIWNKGRLDAVPDICHEDMVFRGSLGVQENRAEGFAEYVCKVRGALKGYQCDIEETVVEGERVFARMHFTGLHTGDFLGYAPTGARVHWAGAALFHTAHGRVANLWVLGDLHGLLTQLADNAKSQSVPESPE